MSAWNYRLTVHTVDGADLWCVRELYYSRAGRVIAWDREPSAASGESWKECADELARMAGLVVLPVYDLDTDTWCDRRRRSLGHVPFGGRSG